ncbi:Uncharacterized protein APZ42_021532 [Daphnia magna]|uniref:Uncharacterized protein n=1 Tax=Daphnia magna TaxID=35525 RepID=A0A164WL03_9CRUS|nr:Uncharacterized protein APZ42_021532 [Daphnia magna]
MNRKGTYTHEKTGRLFFSCPVLFPRLLRDCHGYGPPVCLNK